MTFLAQPTKPNYSGHTVINDAEKVGNTLQHMTIYVKLNYGVFRAISANSMDPTIMMFSYD